MEFSLIFIQSCHSKSKGAQGFSTKNTCYKAVPSNKKDGQNFHHISSQRRCEAWSTQLHNCNHTNKGVGSHSPLCQAPGSSKAMHTNHNIEFFFENVSGERYKITQFFVNKSKQEFLITLLFKTFSIMMPNFDSWCFIINSLPHL